MRGLREILPAPSPHPRRRGVHGPQRRPPMGVRDQHRHRRRGYRPRPTSSHAISGPLLTRQNPLPAALGIEQEVHECE